MITPGTIGLAGVLISFAGLHMLWLSRDEVLAWMEKFFRTFRSEYARRGGLECASGATVSAADPGERHTLRMVGSLVLLFLGPALVLVELALRFLA